MTHDIKEQPISRVQWVSRETLKPNDYNPNKVAPPEMELLITSILEDGWTQPIVVLPDYTIVDGFHRFTVSGDKRLMERFGGMIPTVMIDIDPVHRQMSTIRHNRARGTHGILPMAHIVQNIINEGVSKEEVQARLGMEDEEVDRLVDRAGMPEQAERKQAGFGSSWKPKAK
jgi:ParB-like chromosome segregation protein Spo0J